MLFNSYAFLFGFLPSALLIFYGLRRYGRLSASVVFLGLASVAFYAYWKPSDTWILIGSILFNYFCAGLIARAPAGRARLLLGAGVVGDLGLLIYYKYFDFLAANAGLLVGVHVAPRGIVMPIGISFFTFTQIAYLVDCHKSRTHEGRFSSYLLFVTIFPHLIAGPIIHHAQMRPQFSRLRADPVPQEMIGLGILIFVIGLAKKVLLADNLVAGADAIFNAADHGVALGAASAWIGAIAYTLQIYFDFSGYSDMAIGLALLFGLRLPVNFDSPYKSRSIIEFWRRWHITLSTWLRDYIYIPLGGNRHGESGRLRNVFVTFFLGGIWHGAGWTFVIWGALHGSYVVANHLIRKATGVTGEPDDAGGSVWIAALKQAGTMLLVIVGWVFFRAKTVAGALGVLESMAFLGPQRATSPGIAAELYLFMAAAAAIALFAPSTQRLTRYTAKLAEPLALPSSQGFTLLRPGTSQLVASPLSAMICGVLFAAALACIWRPAVFIYFNF